MEKLSMGIIYTIKRNGYSREAIKEFLHSFTDTPINYYTDEILDSIMERTMVAAVRDNEHPQAIVSDFFYWQHYPWNYSKFDAICAALGNIQVRRENYSTEKLEYINGFMPLEGFYD